MSKRSSASGGGKTKPDSMTGQQKGVLSVAVVTAFIAPFMMSSLNLSVTDISSQFGAAQPPLPGLSTRSRWHGRPCIPFGHWPTYGPPRILVPGIACSP